MEGRLFEVNRASIVALSVRILWSGFPYLCNISSELLHLLLKLYKSPTYLMGCSRGMLQEWQGLPSLVMVDMKVKTQRMKKIGKSQACWRSMGRETVKWKGARLCSMARRGHARSLEQDLRVQEGGMVVPGSTGWSCQISGSNFQSAGFLHGMTVLNFWFRVFGIFIEFEGCV